MKTHVRQHECQAVDLGGGHAVVAAKAGGR
jgi:hypothetical protein